MVPTSWASASGKGLAALAQTGEGGARSPASRTLAGVLIWPRQARRTPPKGVPAGFRLRAGDPRARTARQ